jgi:hypothetical protein
MSKVSDEEVAAANAAYDALPGTPPDAFSFLPGQPTRDEIAAKIAEWPDMTFARLTEVDDPGVWVELWRIQPYKQAAFDPPYTVAEVG